MQTYLLSLLSIIFGLAGFKKLARTAGEQYRYWGFPDGFRFGLAAVELLAVVALWMEPYRIYALGILGLILLGAIGTLVKNSAPANRYILAIASLALLLLVGYLDFFA